MINLAWLIFNQKQNYSESYKHKHGIYKKKNAQRVKEIFDSVLYNNIIFDWKVASYRIIISNYRLR